LYMPLGAGCGGASLYGGGGTPYTCPGAPYRPGGWYCICCG